MKRQIAILSIAVFATLFFTSCPEKGCTDVNSLSYDISAEKDDGSCKYSKVTFYANLNIFNSTLITSIDVSVDGNNIGSITTFYPTAPGNCSAPGTVSYQFEDGRTIDWNTTVHLEDGSTTYESGTVKPDKYSECIKINVTTNQGTPNLDKTKARVKFENFVDNNITEMAVFSNIGVKLARCQFAWLGESGYSNISPGYHIPQYFSKLPGWTGWYPCLPNPPHTYNFQAEYKYKVICDGISFVVVNDGTF